jgi:N-acetylglucosaminyldiphosphoundecaprenol N-acetyl-beta-D-mannosaminyltransferase
MNSHHDARLFGLQIGVGSLKSLLDQAMISVSDRHPPFKFACANPHSLVAAQKTPRFMTALQACNAVVADGVGVTLIGRLTGIDVGPRITGLDFFLGLMSRLDRRGGRAFLFGSSDAVLERMVSRTRRDFPNVIVETLSPPFGEWSDAHNDAMITRIREAKPDVLWVGMTAPKQEIWVHTNANRVDVPVVGSVGAVFDYYAGTVKRAPQWLCKLGLEWLYRLAGEPRRLWRRTLISAPIFVFLVVRERLATMWRGAANS